MPRNTSAVKDLPNEFWKDIPEWEDSYQVSNFSRVCSVDRPIPTIDGRLQTHWGKLLIKGQDDKQRVRLQKGGRIEGGISKSYLVRDLVTLLFPS